MKQEILIGLQGCKEVDTCKMLDSLQLEQNGRCRKGTKAVGRACCDQKQPVVIEFNAQIGVALTHVADFVKGRHQLEREVKEAAEVVLRGDRGLERKQK